MADQNDVPQRLTRWQKKWEDNDVRFHKAEVNQALVAHHDQIVLGRREITFLIPLCGKSLDIFWLYQQGHTVIGIEGIEKAILDFFSEHKINYEIREIGPGSVYETGDGRLRIHHGDFFEYSRDIIGEVDCVWDRGALVAVYEKDRSRYAQMMKSFLKPTFHYLLQTLEHNSTDSSDVTPRSVSCDEVVQLFGDMCNVEILQTLEVKREDLKQIKGTDIHIHMHNLLLTRKTG